MNKEDIIRMAREAGWNGIYSKPILSIAMQEEDFLRFAALVAAAEREKCKHSPFMQRFAALVAATERERIAELFDGEVWAYDYREIAARIRGNE